MRTMSIDPRQTAEFALPADEFDNKPKHLIWLDFETTGLEPEEHEILEIGAVVTTPNLTVKAQYHDLHEIATTASLAEPARRMHMNNGLLADVAANGRNWYLVYHDFIKFVNSFEPPHVLAGFGVGHMELPWMKVHFPHLWETHFLYYVYDVSVVRRLIKTVRPDKAMPSNDDHRALMDVFQALQDWRFYGDLMKKGLF